MSDQHRKDPAAGDGPAGNDDTGNTYSAESVRQGTIMLRSRQRRAIFIAGLVGMVVLVLLLAVFR